MLVQVFETFDFALAACPFWDPAVFRVLIRLYENMDFAEEVCTF